MGEQTQTQTQTESQPHHDSTTTTTTTTTNTSTAIVEATPKPTKLTNGPTQTSSPPSKIHFRPRKIWKVSPDETPDPNNSTQIVPIATTETQTQPRAPILKPKSTKSKIVQLHAAVQAVLRMVARSLSCEGEVEIALRHLRSANPNLSPLIDLHPLPVFDTFQTPFLALTRSILYQQLAYKAGTSIYTRFRFC